MTYIREPTYGISFRFRKILVPMDGSENSLMALELALDMSQRYGSKITVLYVYGDDDQKEADKVIEKARRKADKFGLPVEYKTKKFKKTESSVATEVVKESIEGGYDAIIMGARGTTVSEEIQVGSTALAVVNASPITIILVR